MPPGGFEPVMPQVEQPETHVLDGAATGNGFYMCAPTDIATEVNL